MGDGSSSDSESSGESNGSEKSGDATSESLSAQKNVDGELEAVGRQRQNAESKNQQHDAESSRSKPKVEKGAGKEPEGGEVPSAADQRFATSVTSNLEGSSDGDSGSDSGDDSSSSDDS
jgi:hypothetical protein